LSFPFYKQLVACRFDELRIPFSFDPYGTPMVKRSDLATFVKEELQPLFGMMNVSGGDVA